MRVLLIEDDSATAQSIELMLKSESFNVYTTDLGEEGVDLGKLYDYDLILLDLNLPDMSGYEVLRTLRVSKVKTPILILSGLAGIEDKVRGLGFGADDYMTKPFSMRELLARTRAVLRRSQQNAETHSAEEEVQALRFEGWELDLRSKRLCAPSGERVDLTQAEARLLHAFLRSPRRTLTRDQLLDLSRGHSDDVFDRSIDVQILRLRRKLESDPSRPKLIRTERGSGYFLDAKVEVVE